MARAGVEDALRESEAQFRAAFELSSVGQLHLDAESLRITRANRKACEMYGYPSEELANLSVMALTHPGDRGAYVVQIQRLLAGDVEEIALEKRVVTKSGAVLAVEVSASMPSNGSGLGRTIVEIVHDVTPRREAERALRASEARLRGAFAIDTVGIMFWRRQDNYALGAANAAFLAMIGYPGEEALGLTSDDLTLPEFHAATHERLRQAEALGGFEPYEKQMRRQDGSPWWGLFAARMVDDELVEFVIDITERKRADAALRESEARQHVLAAELQHRTRNIMAVVQAMSEQTRERSLDLVDFTHRFGDRLAALARAQSYLSRLAEGERVTFGDLIRGELSALDGDTGRVALDGPEGVALRSSSVQTLALALHELATNAVKYGAFSQPLARLDVRWRTERATDDARPWLFVDWRERGVAMPREDARLGGGGAGRGLIEEALPYQLGAKTTYVMKDDGVHCTIMLPVSNHVTVEGHAHD